MSDLKSHLLGPGIELEETHISMVFLSDEEVWKVKKPVDLGFLDFSTLELRHAACQAEVRLNRRLAPHVYLGVLPITRCPDGRHSIDGEGTVVDYAVHMKRLPHSGRFDQLFHNRQLTPSDVAAVAELLATFHRQARCDEETSSFGDVELIETNVRENFVQTEGRLERYLDPDAAAEVHSFQLDFLRQHADLFAARIERRRIRDGHGDLRLEHIYREHSGALSIIDCIEFNDRFRFADVCADIAFLAMDLAWHGSVPLAELLLARYARSANDYDLYGLVDFYESYRAFVRGKISCFIASDPGIDSRVRDRARREARRYFLLSLASERRALLPPALYAVGGVIASGKSTVATTLAERLAAPIVDSDRTRKFLLEVPADQPVHEPPFSGGYEPRFSEQVYDEVLRRAQVVLGSGRSVVIDASFRAADLRRAVRGLAKRHGVPFVFIECRAPYAVCKQRLEVRDRERGVSDGRLEIFDDFAARWEAVEEIPPDEHVVLDTSDPLQANLELLERRAALWPETDHGLAVEPASSAREATSCSSTLDESSR